MGKIFYPKRLRLKILINAEKFSSIASAINFIFFHIFYSFLYTANFKMIHTKASNE
tara:strand:+ start:828 stop:995 length:168 start_codon:yes stop_codon:yes gene_type:complete